MSLTTLQILIVRYLGQNTAKDASDASEASDVKIDELTSLLDTSVFSMRGEIDTLRTMGVIKKQVGKSPFLSLTKKGWELFAKDMSSKDTQSVSKSAKPKSQASVEQPKTKPPAKRSGATGNHTMVSFDGSEPVRMTSTSTKLWKESSEIVLSGNTEIKEKNFNYYLGSHRPWYERVTNRGEFTSV